MRTIVRFFPRFPEGNSILILKRIYMYRHALARVCTRIDTDTDTDTDIDTDIDTDTDTDTDTRRT